MQVPIHDSTLKSLIDNYLQTHRVIRSCEEVTSFTISEPDKDGVRMIEYTTCPEIITISHT